MHDLGELSGDGVEHGSAAVAFVTPARARVLIIRQIYWRQTRLHAGMNTLAQPSCLPLELACHMSEKGTVAAVLASNTT